MTIYYEKIIIKKSNDLSDTNYVTKLNLTSSTTKNGHFVYSGGCHMVAHHTVVIQYLSHNAMHISYK